MLYIKDNLLVLNTTELRFKFTSVIKALSSDSEQILITHKKEPFAFLLPFKYYYKFQEFLEIEERKQSNGLPSDVESGSK